MPPPYQDRSLERSRRDRVVAIRPAGSARFAISDRIRDELRDRLIATPTAARRDLRAHLASHNRTRPPSRSHIIAMHREGLHTSHTQRPASKPAIDGLAGGGAVCAPIAPPACFAQAFEDPMRDYEVTLTDLMNTFYKMDASCAGTVTRADFEAVMLDLGYTREQADTLFDNLDIDKDGIITLDDWTHESAKGLATLLAFRMIRKELIERRSPGTMEQQTRWHNDSGQDKKELPLLLTDHKVAMEMLMAKLGVSAKTNFIQIKGLFERMDRNGSGDVDVTVERVLRQRISKGVKNTMLRRFDKNGDGTISVSEFMAKVVRNPVNTLYSFMPGSIVLA